MKKLLAALMVTCLGGASLAAATDSGYGDWPTYGRDPSGGRFSR